MTNKNKPKLTRKVARLLVMVHDFTYAEVGRMFGVSRQRVYQIANDKKSKSDKGE